MAKVEYKAKDKEAHMYHSRNFRLPKAVYYQCTWIIKDIDRLYRLEAMRRHTSSDDEIVLFEDENSSVYEEAVIEQAAWKLACIREALKAVPEEYRLETLESIVDRSYPSAIAHENTWKKWRRVFIKELAHKLNLI